MQELLATFFKFQICFLVLLFHCGEHKKGCRKGIAQPLEDGTDKFNLPHADDVRDRPDIEPFLSFRIP